MAGWQQQKRFLDFFEKCGVTHVNLMTLLPRAGEKPLVKSEARARDRAEAEKSLGWAWHENQIGAEVYVRPARWMPDGTPASWPLAFLDDVNPAQAAEIAAQFSAMVIETSPGLCHVWLAVSRKLDEAGRKAIQQQLIAAHGGDPGSVSGEHFGRLPGFKNHKRGGVFVNTKAISSGRRLYPVGDLDSFAAAGEARQAAACASQPAVESVGMYASIGGWSSESEREFGHVIGRLRWFSQNASHQSMQEEAARLQAELAEQARARGKRDPDDYAERTVAEALARLN